MAPKKTTVKDRGVVKKKTRNVFSLHEKMIILEKIDQGNSYSSLAREYKCNESSIRTIKRCEEKIKRSISCIACPKSAKSTYTTRRDPLIEKMEQLLNVWIEDQRNRNKPLSSNMIRSKSQSIYQYIKSQSGNSSGGTESTFNASKGWYDRFRKRANLHNIKVGEIASIDDDAIEIFREELRFTIDEGGYTPHQIFSCDETELFWNKLPERAFSNKKDVTPKINEKMTILFCTNAAGDYKCKPLLVNSSENPKALRSKNKDTLPVYWRSNSKAWMTGSLFNNWLENCFVTDVEEYLKRKNLYFKVLLILDSTPCHPLSILDSHPNVKILFIPPYTSSLLQPFNQGITSTFKSYYLRRCFTYILDKMQKFSNKTVRECWTDFSILSCIDIIEQSWNEVMQSTLKTSWMNLFPEDECDIEEANNLIQREVDKILKIASAIGGLGFIDMTSEEVMELIYNQHEELKDVELARLTDSSAVEEQEGETFHGNKTELTVKNISEILKAAECLKEIIMQEDPDFQRSIKIGRSIDEDVAVYADIRKSMTKEANSKDFMTNTVSK